MGRRAKKAAKRKLEGINSEEEAERKQAHEQLANTIKSLHWKLRKQYRANNADHEVVWKQHSQDVESLKNYAEAMHKLATQHWGSRGETRIHWCGAAVLAYFRDGGMKAALAKDERRRVFEEEKKRQNDPVCVTEGGDLSTVRYCREIVEESEQSVTQQQAESLAECPVHKTESSDETFMSSHLTAEIKNSSLSHQSPISVDCNSSDSCDKRLLFPPISAESSSQKSCSSETEQPVAGADVASGTSAASPVLDNIGHSEDASVQLSTTDLPNILTEAPLGKIRLLDVGSCYNPFSEFCQFESIGIDLCPATQSVYQCDFLSLSVTSPGNPTSSDCPSLKSESLDNLSSPVTELPAGFFHVVVFSLLLEYLPSCLQRWQCCLKAHSLLPQNGLLVIVTPDSNCVNKNAPMLKSWKAAIEAMGFLRWKYEKQSHLHCMAFRKTKESARSESHDVDKMAAMLYIPQDFTEDEVEPQKKRKTREKDSNSNHGSEKD